ncbi:MAG: glycoside hydrolase family 43 protein [Tenuifilaceae bacterium]|nr:glycoside hydrolase family 43 protein [Tenuifilaceae bacterium]
MKRYIPYFWLLLAINLLFSACQSINHTYTNPILKPGKFNGNNIASMADPFILTDNGKYYMYVTGDGFPCFSSTDLVNWTYEGKTMDLQSSKWAVRSFWAPEVIKIGKNYFLHYTAARQDNIKRIGLAVSDSPVGPFTDVNDKPFLDRGEKGSIDSHVFVDDDGRTYMYYTNAMDTNPRAELGGKKRSEIWVMEVEPDLSGIISEPVMLTWPEQDWEFNPNENQYWNEGTVIIKKDSIYYLMYSANCFCGETYGLGYATAVSPFGPFKKYDHNPILNNSKIPGSVSGPGHHTVVQSPDKTEWFCVYHSHVHVGKLNRSNNGVRQINIDRMVFLPDGTIQILGPTVTPQPYPSNKK